MKGIHVDPKGRTVRAEPGDSNGASSIAETQAFGLATTGGTVGDTGIAGLTLGGGFGWLGGTLGMTVDNVLAADLVLATRRARAARAPSENPDLFWAIRGGGGNFGVVTSFTYQLHDVGPMIVGGMVVHPFSAATVMRFFAELVAGAPDQLTAGRALLTLPDGQKACAIVVACTGPLADAEKPVAPIKAFVLEELCDRRDRLLGPGVGEVDELLGVGRRHLDAVLGERRLQLRKLAQALCPERGADVRPGLGQDLAAEAAERPAELEHAGDIRLAAGAERAADVAGDVARLLDAGAHARLSGLGLGGHGHCFLHCWLVIAPHRGRVGASVQRAGP